MAIKGNRNAADENEGLSDQQFRYYLFMGDPPVAPLGFFTQRWTQRRAEQITP